MDIRIEVPVQAAKKVSRAVLAAVGAVEAARAAFYILLNSFLAYQYQQAYGFPPAELQGILTFGIIFTTLRPVIGWANDARPIGRYRRKNLLALGNMLFAASVIVLLAAPGPSSLTGLLVLIASFILYGTGESLLGVGCDSLALDVGTTDGTKNDVKAMQRIGAMIGLVIAYVAGALLVGVLWVWFLIAIGITIAIGTFFTMRIDEPFVTRAPARSKMPEFNQSSQSPAQDRTTLWIAGTLMLVTALAEGLINVQYEPFLIARYGNASTQYYITEFLGAIIALGAMAGIIMSRRTKQVNLGKLIIPSAAVIIAFYICLPWLAPTLLIYLIWTTIEGTAANVFTFAVDRMLMDVVRGKWKSGTYQAFLWFTTSGSIVGNAMGSILGIALPFAALLVIAGLVDAVALAIYMLVLAPRLWHLVKDQEKSSTEH